MFDRCKIVHGYFMVGEGIEGESGRFFFFFFGWLVGWVGGHVGYFIICFQGRDTPMVWNFGFGIGELFFISPFFFFFFFNSSRVESQRTRKKRGGGVHVIFMGLVEAIKKKES